MSRAVAFQKLAPDEFARPTHSFFAASSHRGNFGELMEALPCMAFFERDGAISAANWLARNFIGTHKMLRTDEVLAGCYPGDASEQRQLFECMLLPPGGRPAKVWGAVQQCAVAGDRTRRIVLMESDASPGQRADNEREDETKFLEDLFDSAPEAMVIVQGTRIVRANREFVKMFGYSMEVCLGITLFDLIIPEGRRQESGMLMRDIESTGRASMETVRRCSSGEEMAVSISVDRVRLAGDAVGLAVRYRDIRPQKQAEARLQHAALHDPLTGLPNRVMFFDRLTQVLARLQRNPGENVAVVFLDVDQFKQVNDGHGHAAGDAVLLAVSARLLKCLRPQDTVARFGGDEFALLLEDAGSIEDIARVAGRIQAALQRPIKILGGEAFVSASMGIAPSSGIYTSADEILRDADGAMYRAKANGRARYEIFATAPEAA